MSCIYIIILYIYICNMYRVRHTSYHSYLLDMFIPKRWLISSSLHTIICRSYSWWLHACACSITNGYIPWFIYFSEKEVVKLKSEFWWILGFKAKCVHMNIKYMRSYLQSYSIMTHDTQKSPLCLSKTCYIVKPCKHPLAHVYKCDYYYCNLPRNLSATRRATSAQEAGPCCSGNHLRFWTTHKNGKGWQKITSDRILIHAYIIGIYVYII
jgi:hypothetical protein